MNELQREVARRRTFAIISHPDAGKTTLTERLLLLTGAIHIAGSVKARKTKRHAASDWMAIEKERGISVASSVMQMEYRDCVVNLLDTPGHQDFSEDTYRVLTAVDAALMVIDAAKGIEPRTLKLLEVCRTRNTPIITFVNKMDRDSRPPLDLLHEIESTLGMAAAPLTWPVGSGREFRGVVDLRASNAPMPTDIAVQAEVDLVRSAGTTFEREAFLAGHQTPVFFGSALGGTGVREVLDAVIDYAPPPSARDAAQRRVEPDEPAFSGLVFKIQANMDPAHRDRVAFVRVCSGRFERGMPLVNCRTGREQRSSNAVTFLSQRRDTVDEAFAGDILGIPNHGTIALGDTLTEGEDLRYGGLPFFAPELFRRAELATPLKTKQLRMGLKQLGEEGAIQVYYPMSGEAPVLGAVGALQFEVAAYRLAHEYGAEIRLISAPFTVARWISSEDRGELERFVAAYPARLARDASGALAYLCAHRGELQATEDHWPRIEFRALREI
ncbi:MAG TPA: GTP-binding protein, partial [Burkholderiales bacterium]|nr:GTP-binding protein [Burkholderiales bacterium]